MTKSLKIFIWIVVIIATLMAIVVIGLSTHLSNTNISSSTFSAIKNVQEILTKNKEKIPQDSTTVFSPLATNDSYGYMNEKAVDSLFPFLTKIEREKLKELFSKGEVIQMDIDRPKCIRFILNIHLTITLS